MFLEKQRSVKFQTHTQMSLLIREIGGREWKEVFGPIPNASQMRETDTLSHSRRGSAELTSGRAHLQQPLVRCSLVAELLVYSISPSPTFFFLVVEFVLAPGEAVKPERRGACRPAQEPVPQVSLWVYMWWGHPSLLPGYLSCSLRWSAGRIVVVGWVLLVDICAT